MRNPLDMTAKESAKTKFIRKYDFMRFNPYKKKKGSRIKMYKKPETLTPAIIHKEIINMYGVFIRKIRIRVIKRFNNTPPARAKEFISEILINRPENFPCIKLIIKARKNPVMTRTSRISRILMRVVF